MQPQCVQYRWGKTDHVVLQIQIEWSLNCPSSLAKFFIKDTNSSLVFGVFNPMVFFMGLLINLPTFQ